MNEDELIRKEKIEDEVSKVFSALWDSRKKPPVLPVRTNRVKGYIKDNKMILKIDIMEIEDEIEKDMKGTICDKCGSVNTVITAYKKDDEWWIKVKCNNCGTTYIKKVEFMWDYGWISTQKGKEVEI